MRIILLFLLGLFSITALADTVDASNNSPVGYWKTVDDVTGRVRSIIQIYEASDHQLYGKITQTFPTPGVAPLESCHNCDGERRNHPILGLVIMTGLKLSDDKKEWRDGEILDPSNGKLYKCNIKVLADNDQLHVRGYIGFPLLGRTQTWLRTNNS